MAKFTEAQPPGFRDAAYVAPKTCSKCGWDFDADNKRKVNYDPSNPRRWRTEPRNAVSMSKTSLWCDVCYDKLLFEQGKHPAIGTPMERHIRDALWPEQRIPTGRVNREDAARKLKEICASLGDNAGEGGT